MVRWILAGVAIVLLVAIIGVVWQIGPTQTYQRVYFYAANKFDRSNTQAANPQGSSLYPALVTRSRDLSLADKETARAIFSAGFEHWKAGDFGASKGEFEHGLEIDPANGNANFYYGDILHRLGNDDEAREYLRRAVALGGTSEAALMAQAALNRLPAQAAVPRGNNTPVATRPAVQAVPIPKLPVSKEELAPAQKTRGLDMVVPSTIQVTSATLGMNCGVQRGNVTDRVAGICNGKRECTLTGHEVNNPDPAFMCAKDFAAEWTCSGQNELHSDAAGAIADEKNVLHLVCR